MTSYQFTPRLTSVGRLQDHQRLEGRVKTDQAYITLNAQFIDAVIHRWEIIVEHHIQCRYGAFEDAAARQAGEEVYVASLARVDDALASLRKKAPQRFPLDQVIVTYGLDDVEASILQLALVPQLDLTFRTRVARYHNNILHDVIDVDMALALLFPDRERRLQARAYFATASPLLDNRLLTLARAKEPKGSGLLAQELRPPERLADFVLCRRSLDSSLVHFAELVEPTITFADVALPNEEKGNLRNLVKHFERIDAPDGVVGIAAPFPVGVGMTIQLVGPPGTGKSMIARAIARELGRVMIQVDCGTLNGLTTDFVQTVDALVTEARVQGAILVFDRCEPLFAKGNPRLPPVLHELERFGGLAILTTSRPEEMDPGVEQFVVWQMDMGLPEMKERQTIWELHVPEAAELAADVDLEDLATRFEVTGGQVRNAWAVAVRRAEALQGAGPKGKPTIDQAILRSAAQAQIRANMEDYSVRSKVELSMDALVLPDDTHALIDEVLQACKNRVFVMSKWGFGRRLVTGKGICVLFKGEPGTGKTFCSEILASELGMKLYQVSIPKIVSKYIGETEKNISKIFHSARASHSMLLFDEADSLFTKRVSVENAIDRHSNMETNLLLQEIERFEGITILTTNLDKNMDDAFARRIQFKIDFPFPDDTHRSLIWKRLIPNECPIADDIDFDELGANFELSGGHIKNAVVRAAYRAAARDGAITYDDVEFAAEQECKNAGKLFRTSSRSDDW